MASAPDPPVDLLWTACLAGDLSALRQAAAAGAGDVNQLHQAAACLGQCRPGQTCLMWAVAKGDLPIVRFLLARPEVAVNKRNHIGATALHYAGTSLAVLDLLLGHEATDVTVRTVYGNNALHRAALTDQDGQCVARLAADQRLQGELSARNCRGETPVEWAVQLGTVAAVRALAALPGLVLGAGEGGGGATLLER